MTHIILAICALFALIATPATAQKMVWPGDTTAANKTCGFFDFACYKRRQDEAAARAKATESRRALEAKRKAAAEQKKREIKRVGRPNPAVVKWDRDGQPHPVSDRLLKQVEPQGEIADSARVSSSGARRAPESLPQIPAPAPKGSEITDWERFAGGAGIAALFVLGAAGFWVRAMCRGAGA